ncbi:MAG: hypothetical protein H6962_07625 [Chromatiaceae bacterium]|nr:hypothetical protein [Chromatiaceae bacterium]
MPAVLWWGRFDAGYSRNRILRELFSELGWRIIDFHPRFSPLGTCRRDCNVLPGLTWSGCRAFANAISRRLRAGLARGRSRWCSTR